MNQNKFQGTINSQKGNQIQRERDSLLESSIAK
jgi:hypothetical protein